MKLHESHVREWHRKQEVNRELKKEGRKAQKLADLANRLSKSDEGP